MFLSHRNQLIDFAEDRKMAFGGIKDLPLYYSIIIAITLRPYL